MKNKLIAVATGAAMGLAGLIAVSLLIGAAPSPTIPYSALSVNDFTVNGTSGAVGARLKASQFSHTASGITITDVTGVTGAGGAAIVGTLTTNGTPLAAGELLMMGNRGTNVVSAGASVWTNSPSGTARLITGVTNVAFGDSMLDNGYFTFNFDGTAFFEAYDWDPDTSPQRDAFDFDAAATTVAASPATIRVDFGKGSTLTDTDNVWTAAVYAKNRIARWYSHSPLDFSLGSTGPGDASVRAEFYGSSGTNGTAVLGLVDGVNINKFGVVGIAQNDNAGTEGTLVGVAGIVGGTGPRTNSIPLIGANLTTQNLLFEPATLLLENGSSGLPLIVGRTNNGTSVFRVDATGSVSSSGTVSANAVATPPIALTPRDATTWLVDMGSGTFQTNAIAGAVSLSVSNCVAGLPVTVILLGTNVDENITFNAGLTWLCATPATISATKRMVISLIPQNSYTNAVLISAVQTY